VPVRIIPDWQIKDLIINPAISFIEFEIFSGLATIVLSAVLANRSYVGTFLRRTFIDEIPQLINILKGEMSLIGPRPPIPHEVEKYQLWHRRRLSMKPGLTCLWQTSPNRHDMSFDEWMNLDLYYIDNWSLTLDVKIFFGTLKVMLLGTGR